MKKKTIIASRDDRLRHALEFLLATEPEAQITGSSNDSNGLLALAQAILPDLVLLDWDLANQPGTDLIGDLRHIHPATKTMVFSSLDMAPKVFSAGADVCIPKGSLPDAILKNFRALFPTSSLT
jgi:DNA-binding NarL/FixJ family response regulator